MLRLTRSAFALVVTMAASLLLAPHLQAREEITSFNSTVEVLDDGSFVVTETIAVIAEGRSIKRGIFRDFPLIFEDNEGRERQVDFDLLEVKKDGALEPHHTERRSDYIRIYIGDADVFLADGSYTYTIKYETDRQLRYFENHDEINWNVTGNFWDFPILNATAQIILPAGAASNQETFFTGRFGETGKDARFFKEDGGNRIIFTSTRVLQPGEGLTVVVGFEKGIIAEPSDSKRFFWFFKDFALQIISFGTLILVFFYYFINWRRVGRDPAGGAIVPQWNPPENVSPALAYYVENKGLGFSGWDAVSAALLNLAVKGYVTIDKGDDELTINTTDKQLKETLPVGEKSLYGFVSSRGTFVVNKTNGPAVVSMNSAFRKALEGEHRNVFFKHNRGLAIFGIIISVIGMVAALIFGANGVDDVGPLIALAFPAAIFVIIGSNVFRSLSGGGLSGKIRSVIVGFIFLTFMFIQAGAFVVELITLTVDFVDFSALFPVVGILMVNVLFFFLLGAPTPLGRKTMDKLKGLETYIKLAEADRMNLQGGPEMSPQHFERLLPYAIALNLEKPWSEAFEKWLSSAAAVNAGVTSYNSSFGHGFSSGNTSIGDTFGNLGKDMSSSFVSSVPAPKSSSSGFSGGGSSGGGGGGGGGGGW